MYVCADNRYSLLFRKQPLIFSKIDISKILQIFRNLGICAWCPHILIGVLGGQVLPGDPFRQQVGVPGSPSTIWGPLNIPENLVFLKISKPEFQRFENSKCSEICKIVQKTRKHFLRIFRAQISPKKRFRTKNGICTHQVQPRTHMKACNFWGFSQLQILLPIFCLVPDVRTYLSGFGGSSVTGGPFSATGWGPHPLIMVLGPFEVSRKTYF